MAHKTTVVGKHSELLAAGALMRKGFEVAFPAVPETYDIAARDSDTGDWKTYQVKTARIRTDRDNYVVVYATKNNGVPYSKDDADYIIGVLGNDVYLIENRGIKEYWVQQHQLNDKWELIS